ncbi:MAG: exodeoxyribonuclease VII large subunit [Candidatus Omnitrophica bacterium]|nr:exodeoxyribonuclease VII large subunit [Candidatus Omnitrophota bacterium]MBU1929011.1 exodeoxyribonuclease VII large subunit [Candidatus Omnitrophota bacterium]MBU2035673.1 exodeoxyribonuclease VII large subunit [Candidatus Omnitrophota bacterium]MBU2221094.1 exodeoxyribonuclease VII large subunit [Candidatus Omnitrophota bacterium]MBU2258685.1 exodeoxyribonuclease VII large subunit [Candidatus Omnitrophota bacterium]
MNDLFEPLKNNPQDRHVYTVSEITKDIKMILENTFADVWIEGEVSNFKAAPSGHFYFSLKDKDSVIAAAMFSRSNKDLKFKIEDGLKAICRGRIDVYPPRGQYQLIVDNLEPKGIGAQQLAFEQLKKKLAKEGLFDSAHKKELPVMPFSVGIVTSSTGAAVRDILQILKKGARGVNVVIRSVRVQGEKAASEIAEGINDLNKFSRQADESGGGIPHIAGNKVDMIIVSRGGGSVEDLWAFNEELVARAIYASRIPVVSAVGHQINLTLSDLVADFFVETPSAAAKIIVDKKNSLLAEIDNLQHQLNFSIQETINNLNNSVIALRHTLKSPLDRLLEKQQLLDELYSGLSNNMRSFLKLTRETAGSYIKRLEALSPLAVLSRGYSLSMAISNDVIIKDASGLKPKDKVKTILGKGSFISTVEEVNNG